METGWYYNNERREPSRKFWHLWKWTVRFTKLPNEPYFGVSVYRRGMFGEEPKP